MPMAILTKAFCRLFFMDPTQGLDHFRKAAELSKYNSNAAQMSFIYSGIGIASFVLCRFGEAFDAFSTALHLSKKVGDDSRISLLAANLCTLQVTRGRYDDAITYGRMSIALGEASSSSVLQMSYTNLMDACVLIGKEDAAIECMEGARRWLVPERRWKFRCGFLVETAAFALIQGNVGLALELIGQLEEIARDREEAVPMQGPYWKLRVFREAHLGHLQEAQRISASVSARFRATCPLHYLDLLAARAWLETWKSGQLTSETANDLGIFEETGAVGRKALLTAQGFLTPVCSLKPSKPGFLKSPHEVPLAGGSQAT